MGETPPLLAFSGVCCQSSGGAAPSQPLPRYVETASQSAKVEVSLGPVLQGFRCGLRVI